MDGGGITEKYWHNRRNSRTGLTHPRLARVLWVPAAQCPKTCLSSTCPCHNQQHAAACRLASGQPAVFGPSGIRLGYLGLKVTLQHMCAQPGSVGLHGCWPDPVPWFVPLQQACERGPAGTSRDHEVCSQLGRPLILATASLPFCFSCIHAV